MGGDEADPVGRQPRLSCDAQHFQPNQVVREREAPQLLRHSFGPLAADVLAPLEHLRLHLVIAELDLPALVVERSQLLGRVLDRVEQRGEQRLRLEAPPSVDDGTRDPGLRQIRLEQAGLVGDLQLDKRVAFAEFAHHTVAGIGARPRHPMPIAPPALQSEQGRGGEKRAVEDGERIVGDLAPQLTRQRQLAARVRPETCRREQVTAQGHQRDEAYLRVAALAAPRRLAAEVARGSRVSRACAWWCHRRRRARARASDPHPPPRGPTCGTALEEPAHRLRAKARPGLRHCAACHRQVAPVWQRQVQFVDELRDRSVAVERHAQHQPDHLLRGQPAAPKSHRSRQLQRLVDPVGIDARQQAIECTIVGAGVPERPQWHRIGSSRDPRTLIFSDPQIKALTDRHCI